MGDDLPSALASDIAGAILDPDEAHCDPRRFVEAVGALAVDTGVDVRTGVELLGLRRRGSRIDSLWTTSGDLVVDQVVVLRVGHRAPPDGDRPILGGFPAGENALPLPPAPLGSAASTAPREPESPCS